MRGPLFLEVSLFLGNYFLTNLSNLVIYESFIKPNNVTTDSHFLRYEFTEAMLDALGILDETGVIYELVNYRYFEDCLDDPGT